MPKAAHDTTRAEKLAFCRKARAESAAALERYRTGESRYMVNDVDVTRSYMDSLRRTIRDLDRQIGELEAHS